MAVLDTVVRLARGELKGEEPVFHAQLGTFFAGMTIWANAFPEPTQWSPGERAAMEVHWLNLVHSLPPEIIFLADPEGTIMGSSLGPMYIGGKNGGIGEMQLVGALREDNLIKRREEQLMILDDPYRSKRI